MDCSYYNWLKLMKNSSLSSSEKLVAYCLGSYMNSENNIAWPSQSRMARETSLSERTIIRAVSNLAEKGWLSIRKNQIKNETNGGLQYNNIYETNIPSKVVTELHHLSQGGDTVSKGGDTVSLKGVTQCHVNNNVNIKINNNKAIDKEFDEFWDICPKRVDKKNTKKVFLKLNPEDRIKAKKDIATRYSETDKQYIPAPSVYLRGERWDDEQLNDNQIGEVYCEGYD